MSTVNWKDENKEKEARNGPYFKNSVTKYTHNLMNIFAAKW